MARILVLDDDRDIATLVCETLRGAAHEVDSAENGVEGLALFRVAMAEARRYDVIITDISMPEADGLEVVQAIHLEQPGAPLIAMSGLDPHSGPDFLAMAGKLGAVQMLYKPFTGSALRAAVAQALASVDA